LILKYFIFRYKKSNFSGSYLSINFTMPEHMQQNTSASFSNVVISASKNSVFFIGLRYFVAAANI